ncbi:MAG: hypothetical protein HY445_02390 [Candidatus Niyogibacteria bacterium]|nr:hypothetical protein [Candidatus Niyogibacteria bacterium]
MRIYFIILIIAAIIAGGFFYIRSQKEDAMTEEDTMMEKNDSMMKESDTMMKDDAMMEEDTMMGKSANAETITVIYADNGFSPQAVSINIGDTVRFVNESSRTFWPASAFHPTHTAYPGSDIQKCSTAEASAIFDACKPYAPGETYSFTFNEKGKWNYHDHLNVSKFGSITVE